MSFSHSPKIVTSGLILALDAADQNSYPGSGTTWSDISGNAYNGTLVNSPAYSSTNGGYFSFTGTSNYISAPYTIQNSLTNQITICAWVNPSSFAGGNSERIIITKALPTVAAPYTFWSLGLSESPAGTISATIGDGTTRIQLASTTLVSLNIWSYVCMTYDGSILKAYMNGIQGSNTTSGTYTLGQNVTPVFIGTAPTTWTGYEFYFRGFIGPITIHNRALSSTEILQNYNALKSRFNLI